ncbi:hypothetical protein AB0E10_25710 [Streptomyces sp. NPDC048045]
MFDLLEVEAYNDFSDWVSFGQYNPIEQEKDVKFTSLPANPVI